MAARRYLHVGGASRPAVHVVAANLHIVCGTNPPKVIVKQHIVKQLRVFLEEEVSWRCIGNLKRF